MEAAIVSIFVFLRKYWYFIDGDHGKVAGAEARWWSTDLIYVLVLQVKSSLFDGFTLLIQLIDDLRIAVIILTHINGLLHLIQLKMQCFFNFNQFSTLTTTIFNHERIQPRHSVSSLPCRRETISHYTQSDQDHNHIKRMPSWVVQNLCYWWILIFTILVIVFIFLVISVFPVPETSSLLVLPAGTAAERSKMVGISLEEILTFLNCAWI